jgi:hypothetical protein
LKLFRVQASKWLSAAISLTLGWVAAAAFPQLLKLSSRRSYSSLPAGSSTRHPAPTPPPRGAGGVTEPADDLLDDPGHSFSDVRAATVPHQRALAAALCGPPREPESIDIDTLAGLVANRLKKRGHAARGRD